MSENKSSQTVENEQTLDQARKLLELGKKKAGVLYEEVADKLSTFEIEPGANAMVWVLREQGVDVIE